MMVTERQQRPIGTATATTSELPPPTRTATDSQLPPIGIPMVTPQALTEALRIAMVIPQPPIQTPTVETGAHPIPIVIATATRQPPIGIRMDKVSVHHRAIPIRLVTPLPSSVATTATHPSGRGKILLCSCSDSEQLLIGTLLLA